MDLKAETNEAAITNKFLWIDNNTFKVINIDGVERIIDYTKGIFKEVASNVAPFFNNSSDSGYRYYIEKKENSLSVS